MVVYLKLTIKLSYQIKYLQYIYQKHRFIIVKCKVDVLIINIFFMGVKDFLAKIKI